VELVAPRRLEPRDVPHPPEPGPGEALVRLRAVGLCGSDMHWYLEGGIGPVRAVYPMVLGHEPAGEVAAAGRGVTLAPGQRVSIEPTVTCGHCEFCLRAAFNLCPQGVFMGGPQAPGFFREYAVVPAHNLEPVPDEMSFEDAALLEPLAVLVNALEHAPIRPGDTVAVAGAGSIGLVAIAMARIAGAARVLACDRVPHRLALARTMGADVTTLVPGESFAGTVMDDTRGRGADVVIEAAGAPETINASIAAARQGGTVVLIGLPSVQAFAFEVIAAMAKELRIQTVKRSNHRGAAAKKILLSGMFPRGLVTHRLPLERVPDAAEMLAHYADGAGKIMIGMSR